MPCVDQLWKKRKNKKIKTKKKRKKGKEASKVLPPETGRMIDLFCVDDVVIRIVDRWQVTSGLFYLSRSRSARQLSRSRSVTVHNNEKTPNTLSGLKSDFHCRNWDSLFMPRHARNLRMF